MPSAKATSSSTRWPRPVPSADAFAPPTGSPGARRAEVFVTADPRVLEILDLVAQVADTDATVLITGESGTGKEFIAHELHERSSRRHATFMAINCGAVPETLQESELFGHARGAFTGALEAKTGKFEATDGGTLFLDEIAEMSRGLQVKLLRVLQFGEYAPVGVSENRYCDVRIVAATNRDLLPLIGVGEFRHDLYYRLNIIRFDLPPLRLRRGDIPLLIDHFLNVLGEGYCKPGLAMSDEARDLLARYDFPGNVRELENVVRRAVILCRGGVISHSDLPLEVRGYRPLARVDVSECFHTAKARAIEEFEQAYLTTVLADCAGIVSRAAHRSGLSERNFHEKLKKYEISGKDFRPRETPPG